MRYRSIALFVFLIVLMGACGEANSEPDGAKPDETEANSEPDDAEANSEPDDAEANSEPDEAEANSEPEEAEANSEPEEAAPVHEGPVDQAFIDAQRTLLAESTDGAGFGPQAPRDINDVDGDNSRVFSPAPPYTEMNLCNIHFHEGAEHRGGDYTTYAGPGDSQGYGTGYLFDGSLTDDELTPYDAEVGATEHGDLQPGDTIEIHYVYSTAQVTPGPTLGSCLSEAIGNPQLRVEAQVFVLVNDPDAASLVELTELGEFNGYQQAINIPNNTGTPVQYAGSTTGPDYNEKGSPFQVSWSVRPETMKVDISSVDEWLSSNVFEETHAHGTRNLVTNPALLSPIN